MPATSGQWADANRAINRSLCIPKRDPGYRPQKSIELVTADIEKPFRSNRLIGSLTSTREEEKKHVLFVDIQICWRSRVLRLLLDRILCKSRKTSTSNCVANLFLAFAFFYFIFSVYRWHRNHIVVEPLLSASTSCRACIWSGDKRVFVVITVDVDKAKGSRMKDLRVVQLSRLCFRAATQNAGRMIHNRDPHKAN